MHLLLAIVSMLDLLLPDASQVHSRGVRFYFRNAGFSVDWIYEADLEIECAKKMFAICFIAS